MSAPWCDSDHSEDEDDEYIYKGPVHHVYAGDDKRLVLVRDLHGREYHYRGPKGRERLVQERYGEDNCLSKYYRGCKGQERLVRTVYSAREYGLFGWNGSFHERVEYFKGGKGKERKVREFDGRTGATKHYEGSKGQERKVRKEWPDGKVDRYDERGDLARTEYPDGSAHMYDGILDDHPYCIGYTHPSGQVDHYGFGRRGGDHVTERTEWPDGTITHFQYRYKSYTHHPLVTEHPNGQVCYHGTLLPEKKGQCAGISTWRRKLGKYKWETRIVLRNGRILDDTAFRWVKVRRWVAKRGIALHWQERTQMRLAAPNGVGRRADLAAYEADFGALSA